MVGVAELIANDGGTLPKSANSNKTTPRKKGLKQGFFIFLLTFIFIPVIAILSEQINVSPVFVTITSIVLCVGGILRMLYALMFESNVAGENTLEQNLYQAAQSLSGKKNYTAALPSTQSVPASRSVPSKNWLDTNDLIPISVTENTTKLLKDE